MREISRKKVFKKVLKFANLYLKLAKIALKVSPEELDKKGIVSMKTVSEDLAFWRNEMPKAMNDYFAEIDEVLEQLRLRLNEVDK